MIVISKKDPVAIGERWEDFDKDVSFKIAGIDNDLYQSGLERARRLMAKEDAKYTLSNVSASEADQTEYDIQCRLAGEHILIDWKGKIEDESGNLVPYSPSAAYELLKSNIDVFLFVIRIASKVSSDRIKEINETVGKPSKGSAGSRTTTAARNRKSSTKN